VSSSIPSFMRISSARNFAQLVAQRDRETADTTRRGRIA